MSLNAISQPVAARVVIPIQQIAGVFGHWGLDASEAWQ
jgi:hypothetical protein